MVLATSFESSDLLTKTLKVSLSGLKQYFQSLSFNYQSNWKLKGKRINYPLSFQQTYVVSEV